VSVHVEIKSYNFMCMKTHENQIQFASCFYTVKHTDSATMYEYIQQNNKHVKWSKQGINRMRIAIKMHSN